MSFKKYIIIVKIVCFLFFFSNLSLAQEIVVSGYVLEKIVKEVLYDRKIIILQPTKGEFHSYEPTPSQWNYIKKTELLVMVGTESWANKVLNLRKNKTTLTLSQNRTQLPDTHLWFDLDAVKDLIERLVSYFKNKDPQKAYIYEKRAQLFIANLQKVKNKYQLLKNCKHKQLYILGHPVFYYLLNNLGIEEVALFKSHVHEGEISLKKLSQIVGQLKKSGVKVVFFTEPEFERLGKFFKAQGIEVLPLLSGDLPWEGNFITLLEKNLENFKIGLQCK